MRGNFKMGDILKLLVFNGVQFITEQPVDIIAAELIRRRTDAMNNQQGNIVRIGTLIASGRGNLHGAALNRVFVRVKSHSMATYGFLRFPKRPP
jgi:hypothetical protein